MCWILMILDVAIGVRGHEGMLGEHEKMIREKLLLNFFKERPSKLEKGYSQVLVKQTVVSVVYSTRPTCQNVLLGTIPKPPY